jgi:amino acid transporter
LDRPIGLLQATAMVAGIIIGASVFVQPSEINRHVPSVAGVLSVWVAAGVLTLFGALVCAELSSAFPRTGGVYVFLKETLSPGCGFLWGWAMFWSAHTGIIAASSVIFARYVAFFVPMGEWEIRAMAVAAILLLSFVNYLGVRQGSMLQTVVTVAKVAVIAVLLVMVLVAGPAVSATKTAGAAAPVVTFREFVLAVSAALFAYGGWHMVTYTAGETRNPEKTIPRALRGVERGVPVPVATGTGDGIEAGGCGRGDGDGRRARCGGHLGAGDPFGHRRVERRDPGGAAHLFRHGQRGAGIRLDG